MSSDFQDELPDPVDLARARVVDGTVSDPKTPALLRRIARKPLAAETGHATAPEAPAPPRDSSAEDFVLVAWEIRPGERRYRLARIPANVPWRIRLGAFQRLVHRSFVIAVRRVPPHPSPRPGGPERLRRQVPLTARAVVGFRIAQVSREREAGADLARHAAREDLPRPPRGPAGVLHEHSGNENLRATPAAGFRAASGAAPE